jgi:exodeoxyribonuclease V
MTNAWSSQQTEALARIDKWRRNPNGQQIYYLAGFAGVGKTTLAREISRRVHEEVGVSRTVVVERDYEDEDEEREIKAPTVVFGAFTNKAAAVMRSKGCTGAATIHSLIYKTTFEYYCKRSDPCDDPEDCRSCKYRQKEIFCELKPESVVKYATLVIIDEVSMVGRRMAEDLLSFGTLILVIGDPAQLPPINDVGYFTSRRPDCMLTEIHRQALGSPIIQLATTVRNRERLTRGHYGDSAVVRPNELPIEKCLEHDQIIVGTHRTRVHINRLVRAERGFTSEMPEVGEKLICLKNIREKGLYKGTIWWVAEVGDIDDDNGFIDLVVVEDGGGENRVKVSAPIEGFNIKDNSGDELPGDAFAWGCAITCHKAQGSQWDSVTVIDESWIFRKFRHEWLYTAITRAAKRVTIEVKW